MFLKIKDLLTTPEISRLTALSRELRFVNGRVSNPANLTKDNLQVDPSDPKYSESVQIVSAAFSRSREFMDFALPKHVAPPLLCRYTSGMKYGAHADAALVHIGSARLRSDISCTVFVSDPAAYEGGDCRSWSAIRRSLSRSGRRGHLSIDGAAVVPVRSGSASFYHLHREFRAGPAPADAGLRAQ